MKRAFGTAAAAFGLVVGAAAQAPVPAPAVAIPAAAEPRAMLLADQAVAYFPASVPAGTAVAPPILVLLHGADRQPPNMIKRFAAEAEARGIVLLAPSSHGPSWDVVLRAQRPPMREGAGRLHSARRYNGSRDADRVEAALAELARHVPVDRSRTVLAGFSDGATFALALGLLRGHDFAGVIGFSPGIAVEVARPATGRPVFVSHGRGDPVLPFATSCGEILPLLRSEGVPLHFRPFEGGHVVPEEVVTEFLDAAFGPPPGGAARPMEEDRRSCRGRVRAPVETPY